jgi:DNA-binding response OmpR family regulator
MAVRVLVVEDERLLADAIAEGLRRESLAVDVAYDGDAALERIGSTTTTSWSSTGPARVHGDDVCRPSSTPGRARVLMLTAAADGRDRVDGLRLGADDYLGKPFAFAELVARVRALGRRARPAAPPVLRAAGIRLDPARREVPATTAVPLSRKEFGVLEELLRGEARWSARSSCWRRCGTRTSIRSRTSCG